VNSTRAKCALPKLDQIIADPATAASLTPADIAKLLAEVGAAQSILVGQLLAAPDATPQAEADEWLTVTEACSLLRCQPRWIWRNKRKLGFTRQTSPRSLLCSKRGIENWLAARRVR
jgi:hypothetical protein